MCYISIKDELDLHGGQVLKPSLQHKSKFLLGVCNENTFNQTFHYGNDFFFKSKIVLLPGLAVPTSSGISVRGKRKSPTDI